MKSRMAVWVLAVLLPLSACTQQAPPSSSGSAPESSQSSGVTLLEEGVWPENPYTQGLPVPPGTVTWAALDTQRQNCSVSLTGLSQTDYLDYMALLEQEGFSVSADVSEEIQGQDYVSIGTLRSDGTRWLSISYIPDQLTLYISFQP